MTLDNPQGAGTFETGGKGTLIRKPQTGVEHFGAVRVIGMTWLAPIMAQRRKDSPRALEVEPSYVPFDAVISDGGQRVKLTDLTHQPGGKRVTRSTTVPLVTMLDTFRTLDEPHSRIFAGFVHGTSAEVADGLGIPLSEGAQAVFGSEQSARSSQRPLTPFFSGSASPGSMVKLTITDGVGNPLSTQTVHADPGGNWVAPFDGVSLIDEGHLLSIDVTPVSWAGFGETKSYFTSFPSDLLTQKEIVKEQGAGEIFGVVLDATALLPKEEESQLDSDEESTEE